MKNNCKSYIIDNNVILGVVCKAVALALGPGISLVLFETGTLEDKLNMKLTKHYINSKWFAG